MAVGVGMEVGQEGLNTAINITAQLTDSMIRLLEALQHQRKYTDMDTRGLQALLAHIKDGGGFGETVIPTEFEEKMDAALKTMHCPFVKLRTKGEDGRAETVYVTRDSDKDFVKKAYELFSMEIGKGIGEISAEKFFDLNQNQTIRRMELFDDAQIDVIRKNLATENISYSIVRNEKDPAFYDVIFLPKDEKVIEKAVKDMEYDFAGEDGQKYHDNLTNDIAQRRSFVQTAVPKGQDMKIIVDASNPFKFITVQGGKFTLHNLTTVPEKQRDGSVRNVIKDSRPITKPLHRNDLMKYVDGLAAQKAVVVGLADLPYIKSFAADGRALIGGGADFGKQLSDTRDALQKMGGYTATKIKDVKDIGRVYTLENVPEEVITDISQRMEDRKVLGDIAVVGSSVAFLDKDKKMMDKVLDETLYKGRSTLDKISDRFYYEGRGDLDFNRKDVTYYIVSPGKGKAMRDYAIRITPDSLDIMKNDIVTGQVARMTDGKENPEFATTLSQFIATLKDPVCLTAEEMKHDPEVIANERTSENRVNEAVDYLKNYDSAKKDEVFRTKTPEKSDMLDLKQGQAVRRYYEHQTKDTYVDRTMMEKVMDMSLDKKLVQEDRSVSRNTDGIER